MNFLILSDTHGHLEKVYDMYERLNSMTPDGKKIDEIIHCGDYSRDAKTIGDYLALPVTFAEGNCDGCNLRNFKIKKTPYGNILITHGHMEKVDCGTDILSYLAMENCCNTVCFGHTHVPVFQTDSDILMINPGSLTYPRDNTEGSCGILNISEKGMDGGIFYYEHLFGSVKKKKARGGLLRGMINYSDRF
ncbi:MAG: YfcE family phosphodiesterase [Hornefia sp.]|nr:YfcE family phosphodiesterase [Hornefia sp.]